MKTLIERLKALRIYVVMCRFRVLTLFHLYKACKLIDGNIHKYNYHMDMVYYYDRLEENIKSK